MRFIRERDTDDTVTVIDSAQRYKLIYWGGKDKHVSLKRFGFIVEEEIGYYAVTCRDIGGLRTGYNNFITHVAHAPVQGQRIIEVGAGLGEFIPLLTKKGYTPIPIVIDPFNYVLAQAMLECIAEEVEGVHRNELDDLSERIRVILDRGRVRLINMKLGDALQHHMWLHEYADLVVDNFGPSYWNRTENVNKETIEQLELQLLKKGGLLYTYRRSREKQ